MKARTFLILAIITMLPAMAFAAADYLESDSTRPVYDMTGRDTDLRDFDVDYYGMKPLTMIRSAETKDRHYLNFIKKAYEQRCVLWRNVCLQTDQHGRCLRWGRVCSRVTYFERPIYDKVELDFREATILEGDQEETYTFYIALQRPSYGGVDRVRTRLTDEETVTPVKIRQYGDHRFKIKAVEEE